MKSLTALGLSALVLAAIVCTGKTTLPSSEIPTKKRVESSREGDSQEKKRAAMRARVEQEFRQMRDPALNRVPKERMRAAYTYRESLLATGKTSAAIAGVSWTERGPSNVSGRTRAILVNPNVGSGNSVFAAGVAGGLWRTNDITATPPIWTPINDLMSNLAVTCIAADPSNPLVMYIGTGEGYFNVDAVSGDGIFKSTDGGATWNQLASTTGATFDYIQRIAVNSTGVVMASTFFGGLQRSTNGGTTWAKVLGTGLGITGAASNISWDVEVAANGDVWATLDGSIHRSTTAGATFAAAQALPAAAARIEIACAPNDAAYVYAILENLNVVNGIIRTTNSGTNWTSRTEPADADPGVGATDMSRGQAWYDLSIAVDPNNRDVLMVGGVDLFKSTDGAGTWTQIAHWYGGFGFQYVHADQHIVHYQPGSSTIAYFGNDGGIHRTINANAATPAIAFKGDNYNVTQFYACAIHPTALTDYFLAGAQDNGSQQFNTSGIDATLEVTGGDGAFCHIDQDQPQFQFTQYTNNDYSRSANGGQTWTNVTGSGGQFINPSDYDNVNNRMYAARNGGDYLRWDNPQSGATFATVAVAAFGGGIVNAVTVSPNTANRVFFGIDNGRVVRADNAHTGTPTATNISTGLPGGVVSCIEVETGNDNHLIATYSNFGLNSVWESINGGTSWTSVEGNLPDMPIRWALFNPANSDQVMLATEAGCWTTDNLNGGATVWGPSNTGFAATRVDMLQMRQSDKFVIAATHGRGLYSTDIFTTPTALFQSDRQINYTTKTVQFTDLSYRATSWLWNFGDGNTSTLENPAHVYSLPGKYDVTLTINSGASTLTKTQYIHILPDRGTPYLITDGGNFEVNILDFGVNNIAGTPFERGSSLIAGKSGTVSPSNAWVTGLLAATYADNGAAQLWAPTYNMTAAGTYTLGFSSKFVSETGFDGFRVEYSLNKGTSWLPVGTTVAAGWYNNANTSGAGIFPNAEAWFSGSVGGAYVSYTRDISFLAGNPNVSFRFNFGSDINTNGPGVAIDNFFINGPVNAPNGLPVEASPLTGIWSGDDVMLSWETYQESNNDGFALQRSTDGVSFETVGQVDGQGNSSSTHSYSFLDAKPGGEKLYYRYRQLDFDGNFSFSNVVELNRMGLDDLRVDAVFPNPFRDELNIRFGGLYPAGGELSLFDATGKLTRSITLVPSASPTLTLGELQGLAPGIYFVRVRYQGRVYTKKVVKN